jgi:transposase
MAKLTREQKIEIYNKHKQGIVVPTLSKQYHIRKCNIRYLVKLIDRHGFDILRNGKNKYYSKSIKQEIIDKVLLNKQSSISVAIEYGLPSPGLLRNWIKSYKDNGCVIVEKTRGWKSTMKKESTKKYEDMDPEEKVKYLENKNQYLEAENEYLKKLRAVVQARKNQQPKKK